MPRPALLAVLVGLALTALAQDPASTSSSTSTNYVRPLITQPVDETRITTLMGNTHRLARPQFDIGGAPPDLPMDRMLLVLKRTPEQQAALKKLLDDQQDKNSPNYHKWLTPDEFGKNFGPSDQDVQTVTSWLQSQGFRVDHVSRGKTHIEFSGDAARVQQAFHTPIHKYAIGGVEHWANANDPQIPVALVPAVAGVASLHNFHSKPQHVISPEKATITYVNSQPQVNFASGVHGLGPADYATIYNLNPLYNAGINGTNINIAVVARSDINIQDIVDFQTIFNIPGTPFSPVVLVYDGGSPGIVPGDDLEATLDVSWSRAVAHSANIYLVISASTQTTDGVDLSRLYIIDNNVANVMTESFGVCEAALTGADLVSISAMNEQAAAQGITHTVSTGDTGSAGCDNLSETVATGPVSINALASTPFTVAVGGTLFNDTASPSTYWNSTNNPTTLASAKSYIPEKVWNETCTTTCTPNDAPLAAGGGGASIVNHSVVFAKPSWQTGVSGIPNDGARDLPDVSLTAAIHDGYVVCYAGSCGQGSAFIVGGTSASAPAFAGMMALLDHKMAQINPSQGARQGQANYVLYKLAAKETFSQCNASTNPAAACVFNDVTSGNNCVPGLPGYGPSCTTYAAQTGFDLATGLGSVNAANLVNNWNTVTFRPTITTLTLNGGNPVNIVHGQSIPVQVTVAPGSGTGTPVGDVSLVTNSPIVPAGLPLLHLSSGSAASTTNALPGGFYNVTAHYAGDGTFAPSDSTPTAVGVTAEPSTTTFSIFGFDGAGNMIPFTIGPYGRPIFMRAVVAGQSGTGIPTGTVRFFDPGFVLDENVSIQGKAETAVGVFNLPAGSHPLTAFYFGDPSFIGGSSTTINVTITPGATTTLLQGSAATIGLGSPVDLTATITTSSAGAGPGSNVTFFAGGTPIGTAPAIQSRFGIGDLVTGQFQTTQSNADFLASQLPLGQNTITAQYGGDSNYSGSTSAPIIVNVVPDFTLPATLSAVTIAAPGQSGTTTLTITGQTSYKGTINFTSSSCAGLPSLSSCSFSPASITGSGKTTITVSTTAPHSAALQHFGVWASGGGLLAGVFFFGLPSGRRRRFFSLITIGLLATAVGCGGGGGGGGGQTTPGTPIGTYNIVVSATSSGLTHTTAFTLTVQ